MGSFVAVFALLTLSGLLVGTTREAQSSSTDASADVPSGPDWYLAFDGEIHRDHYVLYTGYGSAISNARAADVLMVGNSRIQYGFDPDILIPYFQAYGESVYNLGLGWNEPYTFPTDIILRQNLHPRIMIVNDDVSGDGAFFRDGTSAVAGSIMHDSWSATTTVYERMWGTTVQTDIKHIFPYFMPDSPLTLVYRSWSNGFWYRPAIGRRAGSPPTVLPNDDVAPDDAARWAANAREFADLMRSRGTCVVFTAVPGYGLNRPEAERIAQAAGTPFLAPGLPDARVFDGSHLDLDSARAFTREFLSLLGASDCGVG